MCSYQFWLTVAWQQKANNPLVVITFFFFCQMLYAVICDLFPPPTSNQQEELRRKHKYRNFLLGYNQNCSLADNCQRTVFFFFFIFPLAIIQLLWKTLSSLSVPTADKKIFLFLHNVIVKINGKSVKDAHIHAYKIADGKLTHF